MTHYKKYKKHYTNADYIKHQRLRNESTTRAKEDKIIREVQAKNNFLDSRFYHRTSTNRKLQLRAEAYTIPLRVFGI